MRNTIVSNFLNFFNNEYLTKVMNDPFDRIRNSGKPIDLYEIFGENGGEGSVNFFPSPIKGACHDTAIFVSFSKSPKGIKLKRTSLKPLDATLKQMVQQVLGTCEGINQNIVLITDEIDTQVSREWEGNLRTISKNCKSLEIYYMFPDGKNKKVNDLFGID